MERFFYLGDPSRFLSGDLDRKERVSFISDFSLNSFLDKKEKIPFDYLILDTRAGEKILLGWLRELESHPSLPAVILAADGEYTDSEEIGDHPLLAGVYRGVPLMADLILGCRRLGDEKKRGNLGFYSSKTSYLGIIGISRPIRELWEKIDRFSQFREYSVLILGENGTGKDLVARALYRRGHEESEPYVIYQASASGEALMASDLFGVRKGAYTGSENREGLLSRANGGIFFLDEVGTLSPTNQTALLRVLEDGEFRPLGAASLVPSRFRFFSATNEDIALAVDEGRFRQDLYFRINTLVLRVPPLRERKEDIPLLADHFVREEGWHKSFTPSALKKLQRHDWPGNVRELLNVVRRSLVESDSPSTIEACHIIWE
ncbi:MAG: sigma-54-dependent Fis family transcriptional regulator [Spirochaetales bacterium]|nr:sigma-54-dependent Fis family transcriptional regulator [Spirochaetales bacterium]